MGAALQVSVELTQFSCGVCGGVYAINERVRDHHHQHGTMWNCPYCKVQWGYPNKGTLAAAKRELAEEQERHRRTLARLNTEERARKKVERKMKRVHAGVCPECNRTFTNLARHIAGQHGKPLLRVGVVVPLP